MSSFTTFSWHCHGLKAMLTPHPWPGRLERHQNDEDIDVSPEMLRAREETRILGTTLNFIRRSTYSNYSVSLRLGFMIIHDFMRHHASKIWVVFQSFANRRRQEEEVALAVLRLFTVPALHRLSCLQAVPGAPVSELGGSRFSVRLPWLALTNGWMMLNDETSSLTNYHKPHQLLNIDNFGSFWVVFHPKKSRFHMISRQVIWVLYQAPCATQYLGGSWK
jgi:hypothetical protein